LIASLRAEGSVRIAIMGSGGVGGYFGARLVQGGAGPRGG